MKTEPKQVPILFSTPMVQAILKGQKTQTRRIAKIPEGTVKCWHDGGEWIVENDLGNCWQESIKPKCEVGDLLWVRETWRWFGYDDTKHVVFKAGRNVNDAVVDSPSHKQQWKPSIHMPKAAARIWLRCTGVRAERLLQITQDDAVAEGVKFSPPFAIEAFRSLWQGINGVDSWHENPWVWVYEFEVVSTTGLAGILVNAMAEIMGEVQTEIETTDAAYEKMRAVCKHTSETMRLLGDNAREAANAMATLNAVADGARGLSDGEYIYAMAGGKKKKGRTGKSLVPKLLEEMEKKTEKK